jgi:hypothetical protein
MVEYQIGPTRLGLIIKTGSEFLDRCARGIYNGFPVRNTAAGTNGRLVLEIEEAGKERGPNPGLKKADGEANRPGYIYDGKRAAFETPALTGEIDFTVGKGRIEVLDVQSVDLETVLRHVVFYLAARAGYATLHSVCWVLDGRAYVSCGPAESGKSTIGRLLKDKLRILSDEFNFVGGSAEPRVWRAPVRDIAPYKSLDENYPLGAIIFHNKNDRPYIRRMDPAEGLRELEKNVFGDPFSGEETKSDIFGLLSDLSLNVPLFEMGVTLRDNELLKMIKKIGGH